MARRDGRPGFAGGVVSTKASTWSDFGLILSEIGFCDKEMLE